MRILFSNNYFYLKGGSERVFFDEIDLLLEEGHDIAPFSVKDPEALQSEFTQHFVDPIDFDSGQSTLKKAHVASRLLYSFHSQKKAARFIKEFKPDIAHFHNIYHRVNPATLSIFKRHRIPTFLTLHDYKILCPVYTLYRDRKVCEDCQGGRFISCFRNKCNKGSKIQSLISAIEGYLHHRMGLYRQVDYLLAPSNFIKRKFEEFGWENEKICHVPNFLDVDRFSPEFSKGKYLLYFGRLSHEKGISTLLKAFELLGQNHSLVIAGDGPMVSELKEKAETLAGVHFTGHLSGESLQKTIRGALAIIVPSEWYENAPMSILEAMAHGKPVIGAEIGGIPEMVHNEETGHLFESGNKNDLREKLEWILNQPDSRIEDMGRRARLFVEENHSAKLHYQKLMSIYNMALSCRR